MTLERQPVQSFSDHKIARTFCVSQERTNSRANELMVWSKTNGRSLLSGASEGGRVSETEERSEIKTKTKKNRQRKTKRKKESKNYSFLVFSTTKFAPAPDQ